MNIGNISIASAYPVRKHVGDNEDRKFKPEERKRKLSAHNNAISFNIVLNPTLSRREKRSAELVPFFCFGRTL